MCTCIGAASVLAHLALYETGPHSSHQLTEKLLHLTLGLLKQWQELCLTLVFLPGGMSTFVSASLKSSACMTRVA